MQQAKLLVAIVQAAASNRSEQTPNGWCHRAHDEAPALGQLATAGMIKLGQESAHGIPVMVTDAAVQFVSRQSQMPTPVQPLQQPMQPSPMQTVVPVQQVQNTQFDTHIPLPEPSRRGFQRGEGGTVLERYGFDALPIGGSFFVPQSVSTDPAVPVHRSFSSAVSQANNKLWPKHFLIREVDETSAGGGKGARVWRGHDVQGERPAPRPRKKKGEVAAVQNGHAAPPAPMAQPGHYMPPPPPGGYGQVPQAPGFAPPGFAPPGYAPAFQPEED